MKANDLIKELGKAINIPSLALNKSNVCRVVFDEYAIDFETLTGKDVLYLISNIGEVPAKDKEACFRRLLEANRFGAETGGASLSLDPKQGNVLLHKILDVSSMDYTSFEHHLDEFFSWLKYWKTNYNAPKDTDLAQSLTQSNFAMKA